MSSRPRPHDPSWLAWFAISAALAFATAEAYPAVAQPSKPVPASTSPASRPPSATASRAADHTADLIAVVLGRPLFSPSRRPADAGPRASAQLPRLAGTIVEKDGRRLALLVEHGERQAFMLREGENRRGLLVLRIEPGQVVARRGAGLVTIGLTARASTAISTLSSAGSGAFMMSKDPRSRAADNQDE